MIFFSATFVALRFFMFIFIIINIGFGKIALCDAYDTKGTGNCQEVGES